MDLVELRLHPSRAHSVVLKRRTSLLLDLETPPLRADSEHQLTVHLSLHLFSEEVLLLVAALEVDPLLEARRLPEVQVDSVLQQVISHPDGFCITLIQKTVVLAHPQDLDSVAVADLVEARDSEWSPAVVVVVLEVLSSSVD